MITLPRLVVIGIVLVVIVAIGGFIMYELRAVSWGPSLHEITPINGSSTQQSYVLLEGRVRNVAKMEINGRTVIPFTDETFSYPLILSPGLNTVSLQTWDRFQKYRSYTWQLWGDFNENTSPRSPAANDPLL